MTEQMQKKGMSKGCMVALIVVGVVVVLIMAMAVTCWMKRDDLARFAVRTLIESSKTQLAENPDDGIDSERFNAMADAFMMRMDSTELDYVKYQAFLEKIKEIPGDQVVDSTEVVLFMESMAEYFPELEEMLSRLEIESNETTSDTTE